ncbi:chemotaxis protein CheW, partial [bacterium]|nr:chemotaxis protein CheW [bacterium]
MNNDFPITTKNTRMKADDSYIVFSIQDKQYAINITNVIEVINIPTLNAPETLPVGIIGIFNYKETIIKAIDICPLLGFEPNQPKKNNKFIIINSNNNYFAIHTDAVINIFTFDKDLIQKIPYSANNSILKEIYKNETNQISIVDINALNNVIELNKDKENGFNYLKLISENNDAENLSKSHSIQTIEKQKLYAFNFNLVTENQYILFTLNNDNFYIDLKYIKEFS